VQLELTHSKLLVVVDIPVYWPGGGVLPIVTPTAIDLISIPSRHLMVATLSMVLLVDKISLTEEITNA
jgi:hypothetical protein